MATIAPPKAQATYINIPPPPLPEFYLPKRHKDCASSSSSANASASSEDNAQAKVTTKTKEVVVATANAAGDIPPECGDGVDERTRMTYTIGRNVAFAPPPQDICNVPLLAVYHICRICLRPRSTRYHSAHPIPIDGVPPPPGICRRCRVNTVEEISKVATVVEGCGTSNKMKLGIAAFIPEEDLVSNKEMKARRARELLRIVDWQRLREHSKSDSTEADREKEIVFRHVRVRESTLEPSPKLEVRTSVRSTAQDAIDAVSVHSREFMASTKPMMTTAVAASEQREEQTLRKAQSISVRSQATPRIRTDDVDFREIGQGVIFTSESQGQPKAKITACGLSSISRPGSAQSSSKAIARASASITQPIGPQHTESDIRRIAREEVVKYRQAERVLEAHAEPYAHGRMMPVQRRIEQQADVVEPRPWEKKSAVIEEVVMSRRKAPESGEAKRAVRSPPPEPGQPTSRTGNAWENASSKSAARPAGSVQTNQASVRTSGRWDEREYTVERLQRADSKVSASVGCTSGSGWVSQKEVQDLTLPQLTSTTETIPRSERSERRKWDTMTESPSVTPATRLDRAVSTEARKADLRSGERKRDGAREIWLPPMADNARREIWLPPTGDFEVLEVIEETEPPWETKGAGRATTRRAPASERAGLPNRVLELQKDAERQERGARQTPEQNQWAGAASVKLSGRSSGKDEKLAGTASVRSSRYQEARESEYRREEVGGQSTRYPPSLAEHSTKTVQSSHTSERQINADEGRDYSQPDNGPAEEWRSRRRRGPAGVRDQNSSEPTRPRAFDRRMAAAAALVGAAGSQRRVAVESKPASSSSSDADSDKTRWPAQPAPKDKRAPTVAPDAAPASRASNNADANRRDTWARGPSTQGPRSAGEPEREYIYTERTTKPASVRWDSDRFYEVPGRHYIETKRLGRTTTEAEADFKASWDDTPRDDRAWKS
ncbi:hypothetical protein LTR53_011238 [Teratosphaeriaceae sp. CCFEE 6253]|nr:hypothetical protein LTR53_011238 [Teratosphaeriaceae sp. CCFEE 6253]